MKTQCWSQNTIYLVEIYIHVKTSTKSLLLFSSTSEESFVNWIERSFKHFNVVVESQIIDNIDMDWPEVPVESVYRDIIKQKIENLSKNWKDYLER